LAVAENERARSSIGESGSFGDEKSRIIPSLCQGEHGIPERSEARICRESSLTRLFLDNMIVCPGRRLIGRLAGLTCHTSSHRSMFSIKGEFTQSFGLDLFHQEEFHSFRSCLSCYSTSFENFISLQVIHLLLKKEIT